MPENLHYPQKLDPEVIKQIKLRAQRDGVSTISLVEKALHFYLNNFDNFNSENYPKNAEINDRIAQAIAPIQREVSMLRAELGEYGQGVDQAGFKSQRLVREIYND